MIEPGMGEIALPEHDVDATAAVLAAYRDDPARVAREGARGRALAEERYDGAKIAARIEELLSRSGRARPGLCRIGTFWRGLAPPQSGGRLGEIVSL